jgi:hypothetical protein
LAKDILGKVKTDVAVLKWMIGFVLVFELAILLPVVRSSIGSSP